MATGPTTTAAPLGWALLKLGLTLLVTAPAFTGCGPGPPRTGPRPNLVLISIDSLRADHLGVYGYTRQTSPAIDGLAASGVRFTNAMAQAPWTLPSHASLLTSLYPRSHRATGMKARLAPGIPSLAGVLQDAGYRTHAIVSGTFMRAQFGLNAGFEIYDDSIAQGSHRKSHDLVTSPSIHSSAVEFLNDTDEPFFLFVHYWDVHYDYAPPAPYNTLFDPDYTGDIDSARFMRNPDIRSDMAPRDLQHVEALYDGEIAWVDSHIAKLLGELESRELFDTTIVVLTADHGDEFFEHGEKGHQHSLYRELLHVPLIVRAPGLTPGEVDAPVELVDVMPTLLDMMAVHAPTTLQGESLAPLLAGGAASCGVQISETTKARKSRDDPRKSDSWSITRDGRKLIVFAGERYPPELYQLAADPGEQQNLYRESDAQDLANALNEWRERVPSTESFDNRGIDEKTRRELEALGYVDP